MGNVAGIDLGFVQTKAVLEGFNCRFPSIVKRRSEVTADLEDSEGYLVTTDTGVWNVGSKGAYDFTSERLTSEVDTPKLLAVFGLYQEQTGKAFIDTLVSGLPVIEYAPYKEQLKRALTGRFTFGFGKRRMYTDVRDALVIPQSAGAYYDYILNDNGEFNDAPLATEDVLVFDIGGKTTDGCIMEQSKYSQDSFTIQEGVWKVQAELRKLIAREFRYTAGQHELDEVLRTDTLRLGGKKHDVQDLTKKAIEARFPFLRNELTTYVEDFRRFASIILAGGGAYVYSRLIEEFVGIPVITLRHADYANAKGYRKYGILMQG